MKSLRPDTWTAEQHAHADQERVTCMAKHSAEEQRNFEEKSTGNTGRNVDADDAQLFEIDDSDDENDLTFLDANLAEQIQMESESDDEFVAPTKVPVQRKMVIKKPEEQPVTEI